MVTPQAEPLMATAPLELDLMAAVPAELDLAAVAPVEVDMAALVDMDVMAVVSGTSCNCVPCACGALPKTDIRRKTSSISMWRKWAHLLAASSQTPTPGRN